MLMHILICMLTNYGWSVILYLHEAKEEDWPRKQSFKQKQQNKERKQHESIKGDSTGGGNETVCDRKRIWEKKWDRERTRDKQPQRVLWKVFDYTMILLKCQRLFAYTLT